MSRLTGFLIHSSIPNFYFYNYDVCVLDMHYIYLLQKSALDHTVMPATNNASGGSITD